AIVSGASPNSPLKLSAPGVLFNGQEELTVTASPTTVSLVADTNAPDAGEELLAVKMGSGGNQVTAETFPVGFKFMKARTVKVAVIPVVLKVPEDDENPEKLYAPDLVPTKAELEAKLNEVFHPQLNATFEV